MNDAAVTETVETVPESAEAPTEETVEAVEGEEQATSEEKSEPSESSPEKKQDNLQERIDKLVAQRREAQERAAYLERRLEESNQQPEEFTPGKTLADFDYDESSYSKYLVEETRKAAQGEIQQQLARDRAARQEAEFTARERDFADNVDDYDRVTRNPTLRITEPMVEAIQTSDQGPAVLYYFGKNPEVASRLAELPPLAMAREIGRIEANELRKPGKSTTNAPAPAPKLDATEPANVISPTQNSSDKLSTTEWFNRRNKQLRSNG